MGAEIDPRTAIVVLAGFVVAISVHEFSHALAARLLGDPTAARLGRLTLNPIKHLDPFGTLLLILTMFSGAPGIGWGKPVPVDGAALKYGRAGMALVSAAGPFSNLLLAFSAAVALGLLNLDARSGDLLAQFVVTSLILNIGLAAFNLLPVAPLDGFGVLMGIVPSPVAYRLQWLERYGPGILLILVFSGSIIRFNLLAFILDPVRDVMFSVVLRAASLVT